MKLYRVRTTAKEFHGCRDVVFQWFRPPHRTERARQRPYADLIKGYKPRNWDAIYVEAYIEELFTWDEARQLKAYLDQHHGDQGDTVIKEVTLPVENDVMGFAARAVGGGDSFYSLSEEPEYSLPFKVSGYFNLLGCTLIDNGDTYRHRLFIVREKDDGTIDARMETNPEAAARERRRDAIARDGDDDAWWKGLGAYIEGKPLSSNPYSDKRLAMAWEEGWRDAPIRETDGGNAA